MSADPRLSAASWDARAGVADRRVRLLALVAAPLAIVYFAWLLQPERVGQPVLYGLLVAAELFNLVQAAGFWWTTARQRDRPARALPPGVHPRVDVFVPVYGEPVSIVEPTIAAAARLRCARVAVHLLDDGDSDDMRALAGRHGARYITRARHEGAKAGNINHALALTDAPFVAVLDCDHVPRANFLEATLGHFADDRLGWVQTPQEYANADDGRIASAAWAQQALFFGAIARGKDAAGAMFCAGTNVVFRRAALQDAGGFPEQSLTEDFELSVMLHERGWGSAYVPEVLARGLGPEDMASYVSQQQRWARGCLSAVGRTLRARLPLRLRLHYLLSSMYFLTGWTVLVYMAMPILRITTGLQPLDGATSDQFLLHFAPYFGWALLTVAIVGAGSYTFGAFALQSASFWIGVQATVLTLLGRRGRFVVTPKHGEQRRQLRPVWPALALLALLVAAAVYGLARDRSPGTLNNVAFAALHIAVLLSGVWAALFPVRHAATRLRPAVAAVCGLVLVCVLLVGCGGAQSAASDSPRERARAATQRFFDRYVDGDGRVVRRDQGGDSVSEGQAYALLLAAAVGDEQRVDRVWRWTKVHLQRSDALLASRWADGRVVDPQPASDADLDAAHALVTAGRRMHRGDLRRAGRRIGRAVLAHETVRDGRRRVLVAGPWAVAGRVVNPSYLAPRAYAVLSAAGGERGWRALRAGANAALRAIVAGGRLPPDWARAGDGGRLTAAARPDAPPGEPARYGFDAVRVPIRLATACNAPSRRIAAGLWPRLRGADAALLPRDLGGAPLPDAVRHPSALVGAAAAARASGSGTAARRLLDAAEQLDGAAPTYYGAAWVALGRVLLTTRLLADCPSR